MRLELTHIQGVTVKRLIIIVGILMSFSAFAEDAPLEASWKSKLRNVLISITGEPFTNKLLGAKPIPVILSLQMPEIPKDIKKSTDIESYTKIQKEPTSYDKLPTQRKRQFDYLYIQELFLATRKADAKDEDVSNWINVLDQGGSREGIYQALVLDEVYATLENMNETPSKAVLKYSMNYAQKFLAQSFKEESLKKLNVYSIKRIMTEKGLDLMEHWESKDLDALYRWYALFSADLAKDHASWMKSEIRQNSSPEYHYEWAKGMPLQSIKSEYIVKLHTLMNGLQLLQE